MNLNRCALRVVAKKPAPKIIPRSMPKAATVDCYVARVRNEATGLDFLMESIDKNGATGLTIGEDGTYSVATTLTLEIVDDAALEISHFLSVYEFKYTSPLKFLRDQLFRWPRLYRLQEKAKQYAFNRTTLTRTERMDTLRVLVEKSIENPRFSSSPTSLVQMLYSVRAFYHPNKDELLGYCRLLMDSLEASGDLTKSDGSYKVAPQALVTLSRYDEDNRRHRDNIRQQRLIVIFTSVLALVAIVDIFARWLF